MIRVCICGGRDYTEKEKVYKILDRLLTIRSDFVIISGGATGADSFAIDWAKERMHPREVYYANWKKHNKAAGPIRNRHMLSLGIDLLVAFPGGSGTADMIRICEKAGVKVFKIK
jgi:predicted Rossmann-fold nucleotide-binding protein